VNKTWTVLKNEIFTIITRPSYLIMIFGVPLGAFLIFTFVSFLNQDQNTSSMISEIVSGPQEVEVQGFIDRSEIIGSIPASIPSDILIHFQDLASAQAAMESGEISAYYIIASGNISYIRPDFNPLTAADQSGLIEWILRINLLDGNELLAA
jgi:hypothetical protein